MITLYDYLPSQNSYKIRLLLSHLGRKYRTKLVSIFEDEARTPEFLSMNPMGAVPVLQLEDGRAIAESNAILTFLADGTTYLPAEPYLRAKTMQWLFFERSYVGPSIATLRYWTLTGILGRQPDIEWRRALGAQVLAVLDSELRNRPFLAGTDYTIADMSIFAYTHLATEADFDLASRTNLVSWTERVRAQPGFLAVTYPYSLDPHSSKGPS